MKTALIIFILWGAWLSFRAVKKVSVGKGYFDVGNNFGNLLVLITSPAIAHGMSHSLKKQNRHALSLIHLMFAAGMWALLLCGFYPHSGWTWVSIICAYLVVWLSNLFACRTENKEPSAP